MSKLPVTDRALADIRALSKRWAVRGLPAAALARAMLIEGIAILLPVLGAEGLRAIGDQMVTEAVAASRHRGGLH